MPTYTTVITDVGAAKLSAAITTETPLVIEEMAVGDDGTLHTAGTTALNNEVERVVVNRVFLATETQVVLEGIIPADSGGYTIREVGFFDEEGDLIVVSQYPDTYKPDEGEGSARTSVIRIAINIDTPEAFAVTVDMSVVLTTRDDFDAHLADDENPHDVTISQLVASPMNGGIIVVSGGTPVWRPSVYETFETAVKRVQANAHTTYRSFQVMGSCGFDELFALAAGFSEHVVDDTPNVIATDGELVVVGQELGAGDVILTALLAETGATVWTQDFYALPRVTDVAFANGDSVVVLGNSNGGPATIDRLMRVDGSQHASWSGISLTGTANAIAVHGDHVYVGHDAQGDGTCLTVYDLADGSLAAQFTTTDGTKACVALAACPAGVFALFDVTGEDNLELYSAAAKVSGVDTGDATGGRLCADGGGVLVMQSNAIELWGVDTVQTAPVWTWEGTSLVDVRSTRDHVYAVSSSTPRSVTVIDRRTGASIAQAGSLYAVACVDGRYMYTVTAAGSVRRRNILARPGFARATDLTTIDQAPIWGQIVNYV